MNLKQLTPQDIANKTVLLRVDYNVPLETNDAGEIEIRDTKRIEDSLPTIKFLAEHKAKIVIMAHLGRPKQKEPTLSLAPIAKVLRTMYQGQITFCSETIGPEAKQAVAQLKPGEALLIENLRYYDEEEANDTEFAKHLSELADVYVNDAFSASHRAHASIVGVTNHLPSFAGLGLQKEVETLSKLLDKPEKPFVVILGGAKISDKVGAVEHLSNLADIVLVGGAVANNFLKAEGLEIYRSYIEDASSDTEKREINYVDFAAKMIASHKNEHMLKDGYIPLPKILYPIDVVAAPSLFMKDASDKKQMTRNNEDTKTQELVTMDQGLRTIDLTQGMNDTDESVDLQYLDIGPKTTKLYREILLQAGTIFWNGPMGVWEKPEFRDGTLKIAEAIAKSGAHTVVGGGDTIAAIDSFDLEHRFEYVSAAGGAALEFLSGEVLPGIAPLIASSN